MREPPKAPPLKASMSEKQEVGVGREGQVAKSYNKNWTSFMIQMRFKFITKISVFVVLFYNTGPN